MIGLTKILAENQKEMSRHIAAAVRKTTIHQNMKDSNSETENNHTSVLTPTKSKATTSKITPISSRNNDQNHNAHPLKLFK